MCGIAGIVKSRGGCVDRDRLAAMVGMLEHRGPDDRGVYASKGTGLAHARLSIIDLEGGRQPMSIAGGQLWITLTGKSSITSSCGMN